MTPEQVLAYSDNAFGTADAIAFRKDVLRISDLKTGVIAGSVHQLEIYEALFCLEYGVNPFNIEAELRLYQNDEIELFVPDPDDIMHIMEKIKSFDRRINEIMKEVLM